MAFNRTRGIDENVAMNKKVLSLLLSSFFVLAIFGGHIPTAGLGGQQILSHSTLPAENSRFSGVPNDSALLNVLGQNDSYKSTSIAMGVPHTDAIDMQAPSSSKFQYDLITFVNCPFVVWGRFQSNDTTYYANKPAELYRWTPISSQWEKIRDGTTNADGRVEFLLVKENEPGIYKYIVSCQGNYGTPFKTLITYPVIFVHGYLGSSDKKEYPWKDMTQALDNAGFIEGIHYFVFNYDSKAGATNAIPSFVDFIEKLKANYSAQYNYSNSKFTIVCHSMGALVTRWYMEREGGAENVTQWIGIAPASHGGAFADRAPDVLLSTLDPLIGKRAYTDTRTDSDIVKGLDDPKFGAKGLAPNVTYRVIVGNNTNNVGGFGSDISDTGGLPAAVLLDFLSDGGGKTWARLPGCTDTGPGQGCYYRTFRGDGVLANVQSWIDGADFHSFAGVSHVGVTHNRTVINYMLTCIENPNTTGHKVSLDTFLYPNDPDAPH